MKKLLFTIMFVLTLTYNHNAWCQSYGGLDFKKIETIAPSKLTEKITQIKRGGESEPNITVSYSGFDLKKSLTGRVSCGATFFVENNTPHRLSKFVADLDWTGIFTKIDFSSIESNQSDFVRYRLLGDGCYTMVEKPEITVSRCRLSPVTESIKEMNFDDEKDDAKVPQGMISQEECKSLVTWRPPSVQ